MPIRGQGCVTMVFILREAGQGRGEGTGGDVSAKRGVLARTCGLCWRSLAEKGPKGSKKGG